MIGNDYHEGDMADELAELEFNSISLEEARQIARQHIRDLWRERAQKDPDSVRRVYRETFDR